MPPSWASRDLLVVPPPFLTSPPHPSANLHRLVLEYDMVYMPLFYYNFKTAWSPMSGEVRPRAPPLEPLAASLDVTPSDLTSSRVSRRPSASTRALRGRDLPSFAQVLIAMSQRFPTLGFIRRARGGELVERWFTSIAEVETKCPIACACPEDCACLNFGRCGCECAETCHYHFGQYDAEFGDILRGSG
jgi:hypothetical protein